MARRQKLAEKYKAENLWELAEREMALEAPKNSSQVRLVSPCSELLDNLEIIYEDATRFFDNNNELDFEESDK